MKSKILLSIALLTLIVSCKKETAATPTAVIEKPNPSQDACYEYAQKGDKIELQLHYIANSDSVNGTLNIAYAEKDRNSGIIHGKVTDSILIANYVFQSEGLKSIRQVAFKFQNGKLVEGFGEMNADGTSFLDANHLTFSSAMPLARIDFHE